MKLQLFLTSSRNFALTMSYQLHVIVAEYVFAVMCVRTLAEVTVLQVAKLLVEHFAAGCSDAAYGSFAYFYQSINQYYCNGILNCVICVVL